MKTVRTHHNRKTRTHTEEVYRDEVVIEGEKNYFVGYTATYAFQMKAPNLQAPDFLNSQVGQILGTAICLLGDQSAHHLESRGPPRCKRRGPRHVADCLDPLNHFVLSAYTSGSMERRLIL